MRMARAIFWDPIIGQDAEYVPQRGMPKEIRVIFSRDAQIIQDDAVMRADVVSILREQVREPAVGDRIITSPYDPVGKQVWVLAERIMDDGEETRWAARRAAKSGRYAPFEEGP